LHYGNSGGAWRGDDATRVPWWRLGKETMMDSKVHKSGWGIARTVSTVVLAVAAAGVVVPLVAWAMPGDAPAGMGRGNGGPFMGRMLDHMLDDVDASAAQREQIKQITDLAQADMKAQHAAGRALRDQALALLTAPTLDATAAEALRQQMLAQHDQASRRMMQAMLDVGNVLTPAQRAKLAEKMKRHRGMMAHRMGPPDAPGS
jgi:periplasmic protein CpxP/Spy